MHVNYNQCIDLYMENERRDTLYNHEKSFPNQINSLKLVLYLIKDCTFKF